MCGNGDIKLLCYDKLCMMSKFIIRFYVQGPGVGLGLGFQNVVWVVKGYGCI